MASEQKKYTYKEWMEEAKLRFGEDPMKWKFICPSCNHIWSVQDWKSAGAEEGEVAFSCVGRHLGAMNESTFKGENPTKGCTYAGGGLFRINPITVKFEDGTERNAFDFAPEE